MLFKNNKNCFSMQFSFHVFESTFDKQNDEIIEARIQRANFFSAGGKAHKK